MFILPINLIFTETPHRCGQSVEIADVDRFSGRSEVEFWDGSMGSVEAKFLKAEEQERAAAGRVHLRRRPPHENFHLFPGIYLTLYLLRTSMPIS